MDNNNESVYKEFLSLEEVASFLAVDISTIYRYLKDPVNPLPAFRISAKTIRVKKSELDEWMKVYKETKNEEKKSN